MNFDFVLILASSFFCLQSNRPKNFSGSRYAVEQSPYTISTTSITNVSFEIEVKNKPIGENNCLINVKESLSKNTVFEYNSSDCSGDKIKNLHPATQYEITLEPNESIYSGNSTASVTTKHSVSFIMKDISTISVTITITFTPIIDFETERCSIVLSKDSIIVNEQNSTSCIEANFSKLIPGTKYDVDLIYINYTYSTGFGTLSDHTLELIESNLTCTSVQIDKNFNPNVYNPEKEQCTNILLEGDSKTISCIGVNCESSCLSNSYTNLTPSTIYTFVSSSYPYITSVATKIRFITKSYTPYILSFSNIEANGFIVSIENRPTVLENCKLNVTEEITGTITIFNQSDECYNFTVTDLLPATQYIIYLEASNDVYCNQANASIRTKYDLNITFITTTVTANVTITFKPKLSDQNKICWLKVYFPVQKNERKIEFNCYNTIVDKLEPNTIYDIEITYENYTYNNSFKTNLDHSISSTLVSITCYNASISNTFLPQVSDIEKKLCVSELQSDKTKIPCFGNDCETSCVLSSYNNLIPGTKYIYTISSYPNLTSKSFQFNLTSQFINPFQLLERNAQYSKVKIEVYSDNKDTIPPCNFTIYSSQTSYKRDVSMESCQTYIFTGLQPMQNYSISMVPLNNYCTYVEIDVKTTELKRSLHVLETNLSSIKLSSLPPYEDKNVTDTCQFNISSEYDNYNKSYNISSCPDLTISGLRSGNQYKIVTGNKYSTSLLTFNAKTKIQDPIYNFKLSIKKSNLLIQWTNNDSAIYPITYVLKLHILDRNSGLRRAETIFGKNDCNSSCNSSIFKNLTENINYRIEFCARPTDDWCNDLDKNDQNCYFCYSEEFYYLQKIQSDSNRVFYNKTQNVINITYIPPKEDQFGNISYCFISMSQVHRRYDRQLEFDDIHDQPMIGGNQWFTIKVLNGTDCANGNFTLIPPKYKKNITLHSINPGFFYYSAITFCSNLLCSTSKIYEMIYISSSTDKIITAAFLTCLILAIILYSIAFSLLIYGYKNKLTENAGSNNGEIQLKQMINGCADVSSLTPLEKKTTENPKYENKKKNENEIRNLDVSPANEVSLDHSSTTNDEQRITSQIFTYEDKISVNDKNESEQKETVMITETRSRTRLNPEMELKIKKLESEGTSLKFKKNFGEIKVVPNMEIDLIKVVDIDRSFDQMINSKDEKIFNQFDAVIKIEPNSMAVGVAPDNKKLNRYSNIIPGDEHRIILNENYSKNAYINASKIHGIYSEFDYIATQAPKLDTVADFYSMILENNVKTVVMLANLSEYGRPKCDQYLPLEAVTCNFGEFKITQKMVDLNDTNIDDSKIGETFKSKDHQIKDIGTDVSDVIVEFKNITHNFRHFHYKIWPDNSVPQNLESLIELRKIMREWHAESRTPIIVHCSAGVGRTGTFICFDYNLCRLENFMDTFSVYGYVSSIRKRRPYMVQTIEQYVLIHKLLSKVAQ